MYGIKADLIIYDEMDDIPEELFKEMCDNAFDNVIITNDPPFEKQLNELQLKFESNMSMSKEEIRKMISLIDYLHAKHYDGVIERMKMDLDHNALQERLNKAYEKGFKDGQSGKISR